MSVIQSGYLGGLGQIQDVYIEYAVSLSNYRLGISCIRYFTYSKYKSCNLERF
jgi:hypothetical protein